MVTLPPSITVTFSQLAKMIDHSLLQPNLTDAAIMEGLQVALKYKTATACVKPYSIPQAVEALKGTVGTCCVIGFPAGNSTTEVKVFEARRAAEEGAKEIDMVVNIGKVLGGQWDYVEQEIKAINDAVVAKDACLKV
jgi:deoxyribose-phosphate aldolase